MKTFNDEKILMTSDDNSITLTTHRLFQRNAEVNKEILLKHVISHQIVKKSGAYYIVVTSFFLVIAFIMYLGLNSEYNEAVEVGIYIVLFLASISVYFYFTTFKRFMKISSYLGEIEFPLANINEGSLNEFLNKMYAEIENQKVDD